jgi:hypothetical protein
MDNNPCPRRQWFDGSLVLSPGKRPFFAPSVRFHDRLGFRRVGTYGPARLGGVDDYVGGVFYRAPT